MNQVSAKPGVSVDIELEKPDSSAMLRDLSIHRFGHRAMASLFEILCMHEDEAYARQAANHAFDLLDRLEGELSRFLENSDIARINTLSAGGAVKVSRWTMECLLLAKLAIEETGGAFDISLGTGLGNLELYPRDYTVRTRTAGVRLDLGGIGKGYAVDRMADVLAEWGIDRALIHGGCSSVRTLEPPIGLAGWPLRIALPGEPAQCATVYYAWQCVLSASGTNKGNHVVEPRSSKPAALRPAAWVAAQSSTMLPVFRGLGELGVCCDPVLESPCAVAEIFSTAFLLLNRTEIDACRARLPGLETWLAETDNSLASNRHSLVHLT